ncbi:glycosyltransferase [Herbidospora galbida]|uniref:Glycosyltransferase n=1 Tax=Herbidospora galbida TaxID=2575442 RepID=A0A4V5V1P8_9ACTN|nr:glycosyltransferase [Herbidospora galbida]TKK90823.1 glycosyltransferase [Herbidospora galbida]
MRILVWHVHGSWMTAFVHGPHDYLVPVTPDRGPDGRGRALTYAWPDNAREVTPDRLRDEDVDVVVLQRPQDADLARRWLGRDVPAVYVEHNTPPDVRTRHPMAESGVPIVHVTHFNRLFWDNGRAATTVIEHGIPDPGHRYTGELPRAAAVINEPVRRTRVAGTDLLSLFAPVDLFGIGTDDLENGQGDLPHDRMLTELARRRVYVHPYRWTSLGLSLLEAMTMGMPVVTVASTEAVEAVPPDAGALSTDPARLARAARALLDDPELARQTGKAARAAALERYGLARFLADWDRLLKEVAR